MKTLIAVLIILSFIQSATANLDLVLVVLIARCYMGADKNNLYLAFWFGLLIGYLNLTPLGFQSLIYLLIVGFTESLSKSRLAGNSILIIPLSLILVSLNQVAVSLILNQSIHVFPKSIYDAILSLPALYLLKLWEERFIIKKTIKLKI